MPTIGNVEAVDEHVAHTQNGQGVFCGEALYESFDKVRALLQRVLSALGCSLWDY